MQRKYILRALGSRYWGIYVALGGSVDEGTSCLNWRLLHTGCREMRNTEVARENICVLCLYLEQVKMHFSTKSNS
jgi:hypothetical protein